MEQISLNWEPERRSFRVGELTAEIRNLLGNSFGDIWVAGEISGAKYAASGHVYFTLKDAVAQLRCVCYRTSLRWIQCKPQDGLAVMARGRIDVYDARGEYQLIVEAIEPQGFGALQLAFEQLKRKLEAEGLFAAGRKRPLPRYPRRIGIVTSPTGAVIRDVIHVLERRFPGLHLRLYPAQVQGVGSVEAIVEGIDYFSRSGWAEVIIVCRGGGSLEDLWSFNEEAVARAIAGSSAPVISAVGHETDFTISDFVADLRAPTPSAAAEMVIRAKEDVFEQMDAAVRRAVRAVRYCLSEMAARVHRQGTDRALGVVARRIGRLAQRVDEIDGRAREILRAGAAGKRRQWREADARLRADDPRVRLVEARRRLEALTTAAEHAVRLAIARERGRLEPLAAELNQMSPLRVLERGYAIVAAPDGRILRSGSDAAQGDLIGIRLHRGRLKARVTEASDAG